MGKPAEKKEADIIFPSGSSMNMLKTMTFWRNGPFELNASYASDSLLLPKTSKELGNFRIELPPQPESKKVEVKAKLQLHGTFDIAGATLVEEEEYEETIKEKRELPPDPEPEEPDEPEEPEEPAKGDEDVKMKNGDAPKADQEAGEEKKPESGESPPETIKEKLDLSPSPSPSPEPSEEPAKGDEDVKMKDGDAPKADQDAGEEKKAESGESPADKNDDMEVDGDTTPEEKKDTEPKEEVEEKKE